MKVNCFRKNILVGFEDLKNTSPNGIKEFMEKNNFDYITGKYCALAIKYNYRVFINADILVNDELIFNPHQ